MISRQRQLVLEQHARLAEVLHVLLDAAPLLAQRDDRAPRYCGGLMMRASMNGSLMRSMCSGVGHVRGVVDRQHLAVAREHW